jgi:phosphate transport system ATP-binding protein
MSLAERPLLRVENLSVRFKTRWALQNVAVTARLGEVTSVIGPTGSGKTTLLRAINRMIELVDGAEVTGQVWVEDVNLYALEQNVMSVRARAAMVFSEPNPFPFSVYDNITLAPRLHKRITKGPHADALVEAVLQRVGLWRSVKDRLSVNATALSTVDQQKLCLARAIALNPDVILMNNPTVSLDPLAAAAFEEIISTLKDSFCLMLVTHSMAQAARVSQSTIFLDRGQVVEQSPTEVVFTKPRVAKTEEYLTGRLI